MSLGGDSENPIAPLKKRLRWKSRRGWLELDLLLEDFWRRHADDLSAQELELLADWLARDDETLWRLLKHPPSTAAATALAQKISSLEKKTPSERKTPWQKHLNN